MLKRRSHDELVSNRWLVSVSHLAELVIVNKLRPVSVDKGTES